MHELNRVMPAESVLVTDGGFASHWGGLLYDCKAPGRRFVADRGFASIGYGLPGGIGARLGTPDATPVVALTGDGGLNMTLGELETAVRVGRPLTLVVINNAASGYVKALQHDMLGGRYQSSDLTLLDYRGDCPRYRLGGDSRGRPRVADERARGRGAGALQTHTTGCSRDPRSQ